MAGVSSELDFIEEVVKNFLSNDTLQVLDVKSGAVCAKGENYMSEVTRIHVRYEIDGNHEKSEEILTLIMKRMYNIDDESLKESVQEAFCNEIRVMSGPLKCMNQMAGSITTPRFLYSRLEQPYFIVMEDLTPRQFTMTNRLTGLDLVHASLAIRGLARFHANSVAAWEETPRYSDLHRHSMFSHKGSSTHNFIRYGLNSLADEIATWEELGPKYYSIFEAHRGITFKKPNDLNSEKMHSFQDIKLRKWSGVNMIPYAEKLRNLSKYGALKIINDYSPCDDEFHVLNHGDFQQLNVLFKYNEEKIPIECAFVDFQFSNYNSPGIDLQYFMATSIAYDLYDNHRYSLLEEYQLELSRAMMSLNCRTAIPSLEDITKSYNDKSFVNLIATCLIEPIIHERPSDVTDVADKIARTGSPHSRRNQDEDYRKMLTARFKEYEKLGLFEE